MMLKLYLSPTLLRVCKCLMCYSVSWNSLPKLNDSGIKPQAWVSPEACEVCPQIWHACLEH